MPETSNETAVFGVKILPGILQYSFFFVHTGQSRQLCAYRYGFIAHPMIQILIYLSSE